MLLRPKAKSWLTHLPDNDPRFPVIAYLICTIYTDHVIVSSPCRLRQSGLSSFHGVRRYSMRRNLASILSARSISTEMILPPLEKQTRPRVPQRSAILKLKAYKTALRTVKNYLLKRAWERAGFDVFAVY